MPSYWPWLLSWLGASALLVTVGLSLRGRLGGWLLAGPPPWIALAALGVAITGLSLLATPSGDEPHYLIMTQSLLRDGDLDLRNNYQARQYLEYYPYEITDPHVTHAGDIWNPVHNFGLPLLAAPVFVVAGRPGVVVLIAVMSVIGIRVLWSALRRAGVGPQAAGIAVILAALTLPLASLSGQIYPEVPAFLLVAVALHQIVAPPMTRSGYLLLVAAIVFLPWLHLKYAALSLGLLLASALTHHRQWALWRPASVGVLLAASLAAWAVVAGWVFGIALPGTAAIVPQESDGPGWQALVSAHFLSNPHVGLTGILFDQQSGLLLASPVFALAIPGLLIVGRTRPLLAAAAAAIFLGVYLPAGFWGVWHAEGSSPARFMLPTVPVLALGISHVLQGAGATGQRLVAVLAIPSLIYGYLVMTLPSVVRYGDPDGHRNFFIAVIERSSGLDLTPLFPSFREVTPMSWLTAGAYLLAIALATAVVLRAHRDPEVTLPQAREGSRAS